MRDCWSSAKPASRLVPTFSQGYFRANTHLAVAAVLAGALGLLTPYLTNALGLVLLVGPLTLLPVVSHIRWVGVRDAISEPSVATVVVIFYMFVFPLRGLALALTNFTSVDLAANVIDTEELLSVLALVSVGTTAFVEGYHFTRRWWAGRSRSIIDGTLPRSAGAVAALLGILSLGALAQIILQQGGLAGANAAFLAHEKSASLAARSVGTSIWATVSIPAVWCAAVVAADGMKATSQRVACSGVAAIIVLAQLVVFGSRLSALLALLGVWAILYYSGRSIPSSLIVAALVVGVLGSVPVLSQRPGGLTPEASVSERISEITGYGVLDAALAIHQAPASVKSQLEDSQRWLDLPFYLVPRTLWPDRPDISGRRLDVYVAKTFGTTAQQDSGYPSTFMLEIWLYGGWPLVLGIALVVGGVAGVSHEALLSTSRRRHSALALIWYCFLLAYAFTYYKDGDVLMTLIGTTRNGVYLGGAMLVASGWYWLQPPRATSGVAASG